MRIGLGNVLTTEDHLRKAWEMIRNTASELEREPSWSLRCEK
jgi:hypothetical protein